VNNQKLVLVSILIVINAGLLAINPSIVEKAEAVICQSGQFEGFFVKSAQFCNLVIPEGPPGPPGPGINSSNFYYVLGSIATIQSTFPTAVSRATCDDGDIAISGEFTISPPTSTPPGSYDIRNEGGSVALSQTWELLVAGPVGTIFQTNAICFDSPPLRP
jgi:hypothetical protein